MILRWRAWAHTCHQQGSYTENDATIYIFNYPNQMSRGSRNHSVQQDLQTILLLSTPRDKDEKYGKVLESRVGWSFPPRGIGVGNKHVKCDLSYRGWDHTTKRSRDSWSILLIFIASNHPCLVIIVGAFRPKPPHGLLAIGAKNNQRNTPKSL